MKTKEEILARIERLKEEISEVTSEQLLIFYEGGATVNVFDKMMQEAEVIAGRIRALEWVLQ